MDALTFEGFEFTYRGADTAVLSEVSWRVSEGAFALIGGDTGIGKTTLLRCAHPLLAPAGETKGRVEVFGRAVGGEDPWDDGRCARTVAYVAQNPETQIVCDTVWHELAFGLENLGTDPDAMRRRVAEVAHFFGIESWFHRGTDALSGGQKQLLNLASALVMQPRLLLLDEPTAQLDPVAAKNFLHALFRINRETGITVVIATHEPYEMRAYATAEYRLTGDGVQRVDAAAVAASASPAASSVQAVAGDSSAKSIVTCSDVWFRYDRSLPWVLRGFDLALASGGCHAIVGGNGCGKSTLLQAIAGGLHPERGRVRSEARRNQALLPQNPQALFLHDTVADELRAWQEEAGYTDADVRRWVARLGLDGLAGRHPYDLSGGQQQKVALAKLLLTKPDLLLLDEPTKGLDARTRRDVADALATCRAEGMTIVLATHDLAFVERVAAQVTMLFDGEATATEEPQAFFADGLFFRPSAAEREALRES